MVPPKRPLKNLDIESQLVTWDFTAMWVKGTPYEPSAHPPEVQWRYKITLIGANLQ